MLEEYLTPENLKIVGAAVAGMLGMRYLSKPVSGMKQRRRAAAQMANVYSQMGLNTISSILLDYSVGDYVGMAKSMKAYYNRVKEKGIQAETEAVYERILDAKLKDPEYRKALKERLV